ncbi:MAG: calcium/sodium antiporter [Gammaproteobacteria bacterium]|nr:calcium/sodium antiporter [Gammaproteobacteria bacterium]
MFIAILLLLLGGTLLFIGGEALIRGATALGLRLGLSPLVVGLTIVAFGTSSPELAVSLDAALDDLGDVAIANVVGSNVLNIAGVLGLACLIRPLKVESQIVRIDAPVAMGATALLLVLLRDGVLSRADGALLLTLLLAYIGLQLVLARRRRDVLARELADFETALTHGLRTLGLNLTLTAAGLVLLGGGATVFVDGAVTVARLLGVREALIGLTIIAFGTSLPELATSAVAAYRREGDLAVGNVVGSNIFNVLCILGVSALVTPLPLGGVGWIDLWVMFAFAVLIWPVLYSGLTLTRIEGGMLFGGYVAYTAWLAWNAG